jgi:hypothetical protein
VSFGVPFLVNRLLLSHGSANIGRTTSLGVDARADLIAQATHGVLVLLATHDAVLDDQSLRAWLLAADNWWRCWQRCGRRGSLNWFLRASGQHKNENKKDATFHATKFILVGVENTHDILATLVSSTTCKPGWTFNLRDENGALRLVITVPGVDSYHPENPLTVAHFFPVPMTTYNEKTWRRWLFECCRRLENHELGEWFKISRVRPFAPLHGPGEDPYTVHEFRDEVDARTLQDGSIVEHLA